METRDRDQADARPKRRRVTRACDECRRKKIKCDGRSPCTHCCVYEYDCTYLQPSNRRRNPSIAYVESLEQRCARYEQLLRQAFPEMTFDTDGPIDENVEASARRLSISDGSVDDKDASESQRFEPMLTSVADINRDHDGNIDFRGDSSGTVFAKKVYDQVLDGSADTPDVYGSNTGNKLQALNPPGTTEKDAARDSKNSNDSPMSTEEDEEIVLPSKEVAVQLSHLCFDSACVIIQFVHQPSYFSDLEAQYNTPEDEQDENFLPVIYSSMAVGCLFAASIAKELGIPDLKLRAYQYFQASRKLSNPLDRANKEILQTLILQMIFLHSTANMSSCWTYLGTAMRCAQRMGLHRKFEMTFDPLCKQQRRKMFWTIRSIELYLHAILGLPRSISEKDYDQAMPIEVDDEYLTTGDISEQPSDCPSNLVSMNAYGRLMTIMGRVIRKIYPLQASMRAALGSRSFHADIASLQRDLNEWQERLPAYLKHDTHYNKTQPNTYRQSRLLHFVYCHTYIILYRPFLHYLMLPEVDAGNRKYRAYAQRAKKGAFDILELTRDIFENDGKCIGHLISIYSIFFSGMILAYCVLRGRSSEQDQQDRQRCLEMTDVAIKAMEISSQSSFAAQRCREMFQEVHERMKEQISKDNSIQLKPPPDMLATQPKQPSPSHMSTSQTQQAMDSHHSAIKRPSTTLSVSAQDLQSPFVSSTSATSVSNSDQSTFNNIYHHKNHQENQFSNDFSFYGDPLQTDIPNQFLNFPTYPHQMQVEDTYRSQFQRPEMRYPAAYPPQSFMPVQGPGPMTTTYSDYAQLPTADGYSFKVEESGAWSDLYGGQMEETSTTPYRTHLPADWTGHLDADPGSHAPP